MPVQPSSKPAKVPSQAEEALWLLTPRKIKAMFTKAVKRDVFWELNAHLFYPADGPS